MMHPSPRELTEVALKRLRALKREGGLGAGFALAKEDMQLRGAGSLLGTAQKGGGGAAGSASTSIWRSCRRRWRGSSSKRNWGSTSRRSTRPARRGDRRLRPHRGVGLADSMDGEREKRHVYCPWR